MWTIAAGRVEGIHAANRIHAAHPGTAATQSNATCAHRATHAADHAAVLSRDTVDTSHLTIAHLDGIYILTQADSWGVGKFFGGPAVEVKPIS